MARIPLIDTRSVESVAATVLTRRGDDDDDEFIDVVDDDEGVTTSMSVVGLLASVLDICNLLDVIPSPPSSIVDFVQLLRILLASILLPKTNDACDDRLLIIDGGANATATMGRLDDVDDDATTVAAARRQVRNAIFFADQ